MSGLAEQEREALIAAIDMADDANLYNPILSKCSHLMAAREAALAERIAQEIAAMGPIWGGDDMWLTSGNHVAVLVSEIAREFGGQS